MLFDFRAQPQGSFLANKHQSKKERMFSKFFVYELDLMATECIAVKGPLLQKRWFVPVGKPLLSRFPNQERHAWTGLATGTKKNLFSWLVTPTGTKGAASATCLAHPFVSVGDKRSIFFLFLFSQLFFYFDYTFKFQLNLCIGIQCVRSPLIYTYI